MPELPEVRTVCRILKEKVLNKEIKKVLVFKPKLFRELIVDDFIQELENEKILGIENLGKHIIIKLTNKKVLLSHLRMEGKYRFFEKSESPDKHTVAIFKFKDNTELHYVDTRMFGTFYLRTIDDYLTKLPLSKIAAEPGNINVEQVLEKLSKTTVSIKTKLLDQTIVSGIGNIYVDEALFLAKVHPTSPSCNIPKNVIKKILKYTHDVMRESYEYGGSTLFSYESMNHEQGQFQDKLKIHNSKLKNCSVCSNPIYKIKVNKRGTYVCPHCQKVY
ncbi:DNA-formamidopyrimidine glycosylase [Mycoplasma struthionis]|uniref:DNA-formamidopyrimidine glycosylase n=1 Tax=Mycoplasma struthionis TaxID=538220 RepID=A0A3G8LGZ9_9MOLU|nr:DNA-formamidopyrimidine glycosylase [Mycoplasma struthionis]AZG68614.1 DNA-formamidopyrimidine glycosylase [Mycoplasma struthionis]